MTENIALGAPFTVSLAVSGSVASIVVSVPAIDIGPTSVPVTVTAKDADGNTIIGAAPYAAPITLANSDTSGNLTLSTTSVAAPGTLVTLAYSGVALSSAATISATATGAVPATMPVTPYNYFPINLSHTFASSATYSDFSAPLGNPSPQPTPYISSATGTFVDSLAGGASFNGFSGVQAITTALGSLSTQFQTLSSAGVMLVLGDNFPGTTAADQFGSGYAYAALPFVSGDALSGVFSYTDSYSGGTQTRDASGNYVGTFVYSDGSGEVEHDNADGSGSTTYTAGAGTCSAYNTWLSGLPCTVTSGTSTISAPSNGTITLNVTQSTASGTQTGTLSIPTAEAYPAGVPSASSNVSSLVGTAIATLPAPCAVTAVTQGPYVPITLKLAEWFPVEGFVYGSSETDYLAPAIGIVCKVITYTSAGAFIGDGSSTPPLSAGSMYQYNSVETDSLTAIGPPEVIGTIVSSGHARTVNSVLGPFAQPPALRRLLLRMSSR